MVTYDLTAYGTEWQTQREKVEYGLTQVIKQCTPSSSILQMCSYHSYLGSMSQIPDLGISVTFMLKFGKLF